VSILAIQKPVQHLDEPVGLVDWNLILLDDRDDLVDLHLHLVDLDLKVLHLKVLHFRVHLEFMSRQHGGCVLRSASPFLSG